MTDSEFTIDRDALMAALSRVGLPGLIQEPSDLLIADIAACGPRTVDDALSMITSRRARRLLMSEWAYECPSPEVLDKAVALDDANEEGRLLAMAVRSLLRMHTSRCEACAHRSLELQAATEHVADGIWSVWHLTISRETAAQLSPSRGSDTGEQVLRQDLDNSEIFHALTGRERAETDLWPRIVVTTTGSDKDSGYLINIRLLSVVDIRPDIAVAVVVGLSSGELRIPLEAVEGGILVGSQQSAEIPGNQAEFRIEIRTL